MGTEPGGPSPMLGNEQQPPGGEQLPPEGGEPPAGAQVPEGGGTPSATGGAATLAEPSREDIKRYDLDIEDYSRETDAEDIDFTTEI